MRSYRHGGLVPLVLIGILALAATRAWGAGEEQIGNDPLNAASYTQWKGLIDVVNDPHRVYYSWVNGNENFYFAGDTQKLNTALQKFAAADVEVKEVVLRPGPGETQSFDQARKFPFQWHLQIFGGIAAHLITRDQGDQVWNKHPRLTVYVGGDIDLAKLEVPKGLTLLSSDDASARARKGIESKDKTVRGWSAGVIAHHDPFATENLAAIEKLLTDEDDWVRLNAAGAVALYGAKAKSALPELRACLARDDEGLKQRAKESIAAIEAATEDKDRERQHAAAVAKIKEYIAVPQR
jgi:hypothetical protein